MATSQPHPPLQKPPGYRDPNVPTRRPLPPSFHRHKRRRSRCHRTFCCAALIAAVTLALAISATGALFYLLFQPRLPEIHVASINSTNVHVSNPPGGAGPTLDSQITTRLQIRNPNRDLKLVYDRTRVSLTAAVNGGAVLGDETVAGFTQGTRNVKTLEIVMKKQRQVLDNEAADEMVKGLKSKNLLVSAEIWSGVGIKGNQWSVGSVHVKVVCEGMRLSELTDQNKCRFKILDWFYIG